MKTKMCRQQDTTELNRKSSFVFLLILVISEICIFCFGYLNIINYCYDTERQYIETVNGQVIAEIENSLQYGKELKHYYDMDNVLDKATKQLGDGNILTVTDAEEVGLYSTSQKTASDYDDSEYEVVKQEICNEDENVEGYLFTFFPKAGVLKQLSSYLPGSCVKMGIILLITIIAFILLLKKPGNVKRRLTVLIAIAMLIQGVVLTLDGKDIFEDAIAKNVYGVGGYLKNSIQELEDKSVNIGDIAGFESYLNEKSEENRLIQTISYTKSYDDVNAEDGEVVVELPDNQGMIILEISKSYAGKKMLEIIFSFCAAIVLVFIFMMETLKLPGLIAFRRSGAFGCECSKQYGHMPYVLRFANFLTSTGSYMCLAFSALMIKDWNQGLGGLSPQMAAALSISICSIAEVAGMILMPAFIRRIEAKRIMIGSTALMILSNLACFVSGSVLMIILLRFVAGIGFAGSRQVLNVILAGGYETAEQRAENLRGNNDGIIGGILCGSGMGAILAGVLGYSATFAGAVVLSALYFAFMLRYVPWEMIQKKQDLAHEEKTDYRKVFRLLSSGSVIRSVILVVIPVYFYLMVIVCLIPGVIQAQGLSSVLLTYCNLLNGAAGLYLGGKVCGFLQKHMGRSRALAVFYGFGILSMVLLRNFEPAVMLLLCALATGLLDGGGTPLATDIYLDTKGIAGEIDEALALTLFSLIGFAVMAVAPIVFELCIRSSAALYITCAVLVLLCIPIALKSNNKDIDIKGGKA